MILSTKLLNLLGILVIGNISLQAAVAIDDLDDTLKQALFLVKLLKADFAQILRSNDDVVANSTEEENSTCSLPSEEFNTTMAINETEVTASLVTNSTPATLPPSAPEAPAPPNIMPPGAPMMMPYASWPPMPMGYPPPSGTGRQNFPDENYRFPYRVNRRRMMPDYYYFDYPAKRRGNFRRFDNDPADDLGKTTATSQAQNTSSISSPTSEATTLHLEETTASTTSLPTTLAQSFTSILPMTEQPVLRTTAVSAEQSIPADLSKQTSLPTIAKSMQLIAASTKQSIPPTTEEPNLPTILVSTLTTKHRKRIRHRTRVPVPKATSTTISTRNENRLNISRHHLRVQARRTTTGKGTKDDVEMSQVASELEKELEGTNTEDLHASYKNVKHQMLKKKHIKTTATATRTTKTMKVFLQGSSRIPVPFPENNGFCHFHPENALCGAN